MIVYTQIFYWIFLLLIISSCFESFKYTLQPKGITKANYSGTALLHWKYVLDPGEILINNECFLRNNTFGPALTIASGKNFQPTTGFSKVTTLNTNTSISIANVDYQEAGFYSLRVTTAIKGKTGDVSNYPSVQTFLAVQGPPSFCAGLPNAVLNIKENASLSVLITLCASPIPKPQPTLKYKWYKYAPVEVITSNDDMYYTRFIANVTLPPLQRDRCGGKMAYHGLNSFGVSNTQEATINVLFKPTKPKNVKAYYKNDGKHVLVTWDGQESGSCKIDYNVTFLDQRKKTVATKLGKNINTTYVLNPKFNKITSIVVVASTSEGMSSTKVEVFSDPSNNGGDEISVWIILGLVLGGILLLIIIIIAIIYGKQAMS